MGYIRIPVSLKIEDEGDFYDFVLSLRDSKELSSFIIDLLKVYFDNKDIKDKIDSVLNIYNPFEELKERLLKIQLEHSKAVMATSLLDNKIKDVVTKIEDGIVEEDTNDVFNDIKKVYSLLDGSEEIKKESVVESSIAISQDKYSALETRVTKIEVTLNEILGILKESKLVSKEEKIVEEQSTSERVVDKKSDVNLSDDIQENSTVEQVMSKQNGVSSFDKKDTESNTSISTSQDNPFIIVSDSNNNNEKEEGTKVPNTFNKLLKSIKK